MTRVLVHRQSLDPWIPPRARRWKAPYPCRISEVRSFAPYPGWGVDIECGSGNHLTALMNPTDCWLNKLEAWPTGGQIGTNGFPLLEEMMIKLSKGKCKKMTLAPISRRAENFYEKLGFQCTDRRPGVMKYCMEMEKDLT